MKKSSAWCALILLLLALPALGQERYHTNIIDVTAGSADAFSAWQQSSHIGGVIWCEIEVTEATGLTSVEMEIYTCPIADTVSTGQLNMNSVPTACTDTPADWQAVDIANTTVTTVGSNRWAGSPYVGTAVTHITDHAVGFMPRIWRVFVDVIATDVDYHVNCISW